MADDDALDVEDESAERPAVSVWLVLAALFALALSVLALTEATGRTALVSRVQVLLFGPADDNLRIVAVYGTGGEEHSFLRGARMAIDRINDADGGLFKKRLELVSYGERVHSDETPLESTVAQTLALSGRIARTKNLLAVVGHQWSDTAVAASSIYSLNDVLFLATHATAASLTNHDFNTVFALQPDNATNAEVVANYAMKNGMRRFVVLSDKTDYGKESAAFFTAAITNAGADLVFRGNLASGRRSIDQLLMFILDNNLFKRSDFDAFFIVSSSIPETAEFIKRSRDLGLTMPILGMEYLFSADMEKAVGKEAMKDVIGVSLYDRDNISERARTFVDAFQKAFGTMPDLDAALGYDAVTLVRDAARRAGSRDPDRLSDILKVARYKKPFVGVTGPLVFDRNGLITDTQVFIIRHDGTEFRTAAHYEIPTTWDTLGEDSGETSTESWTSPDEGVRPDEERQDQ
ncbi:ABC transporter substrate-binding protein [Rhodobium gokarnense]|uniref:Branched-chain amino acid transport system substrate-binding protein n=1 Tax=Rhodobium gokarnense TaxID=364296 RepID=A0ABT3H856_9HYPH|nr:ABC transporter substrate-binding protein [Rhodobium gokarnense]MCW2306580.1 branched-chain amino acid transport system substrate-binding protein [Rhodobium gokarnense]